MRPYFSRSREATDCFMTMPAILPTVRSAIGSTATPSARIIEIQSSFDGV